MSDFKNIKRALVSNGFQAAQTNDMSAIFLQLNGAEVMFHFSAGGDVLTDVDCEADCPDCEGQYDLGYADAKVGYTDDIEGAYEDGYDEGFRAGQAGGPDE